MHYALISALAAVPALAGAAVLAPHSSCGPCGDTTTDTTAAATEFVIAEDVQTHDITFEAGKLIEVGFAKAKPGREGDLAAYFQKVMPLAMEYGVQPLGTFTVTDVDHGPHGSAGFYGFFAWPSLEKKQAFEYDPRFAPLRAERDATLVAPPKLLYTQVGQTVTHTLRSDRMYEIAAGWVNPDNAGHMKSYFDAVGPFAQKEGIQFVGDFRVTGQPDKEQYRFDTQPSVFLFIEWPSEAVKDKWFSSDTFAEVGHHRALGLDRLVVLEGSFDFPPTAGASAGRVDTPVASVAGH